MVMTAAPSHSKAGHQFSQVPNAEIQRASFKRPSNYKTTFDAGYLIPVFVDEVLPGDTFNLKMTAFGRLATPLNPIMDNMVLDSFFFFVPYRLVWDNFKKFMGEQTNPGDSTSYITPIKTATAVTGYDNGSIYDYMGLPTQVPGYNHSALPLRAYNLIFNEWFRDQNMQSSVTVDKSDGPDVTNYQLRRRGKRHDYFTSCLPWAQKGTAVSLPLTGNATVINTPGTTNAIRFRIASSNALVGATSVAIDASSNFETGAGVDLRADPNGTLQADLSTVTASTINALRQAFQIQRLYERDARGGTRYTEIIQAHFGVTSPDARLQRPEYLGGGSTPININPIAQTSASAITGSTSPLGDLGAMGTIQAHNHGFVKSFTEHGVLLGLVSVRADLSYQQGLDKMWSRSTRFDYYWPALAHLGEQAVLNQEIYCLGSANPTQDAAVFGYQERWAEYRYKNSKITGQFRSNFAQTLDSWHLAQNFTALPTLGNTFIQDTPPVDRILAVPTYPDFLFDAYFDLTCARPMPLYSVPGLIDHF